MGLEPTANGYVKKSITIALNVFKGKMSEPMRIILTNRNLTLLEAVMKSTFLRESAIEYSGVTKTDNVIQETTKGGDMCYEEET